MERNQTITQDKQFVPSGGMQILSQSVSPQTDPPWSSIPMGVSQSTTNIHQIVQPLIMVTQAYKRVLHAEYTHSLINLNGNPAKVLMDKFTTRTVRSLLLLPDSYHQRLQQRAGRKKQTMWYLWTKSPDRNAVVNYLTDSFSVINIKLPAMSNKQDSA